VGAIVVLGGDGTNRLVASVCGETPILPLSTGTNNVFPRVREATIAGLAAGLVAAGRVSPAETQVRSKMLQVEVNGASRGPALVDVAVASDFWIGSRAVWRPESVRQLFVTFAEADAIGLSSIAGLLRPVSRQAAHGLRVDLSPPETAAATLTAPIAPGLIVPVGIGHVEEIHPGRAQKVNISRGVIALDGEREIEFAPTDCVSIRLDTDGPLTIDIDWVMAQAAREGSLTSQRSPDSCQQ
jgi:predicted polyphosphate/ATP-dependent NAD kinase